MGDIAALSKRAADPTISLEEYVQLVSAGGFPFLNQTLVGEPEQIERTFAGFVDGAYRSNGIVFSCAMTRFLIFSQARIVFQQLRGGMPGDLFGTPDLAVIEHPWPGAATADLMAKVDLYAQFAGTAIVVRRPGPRLEVLRPDWAGVISGNRRRDAHPWDPDSELLGVVYQPGGPGGGEEPMTFSAGEVALYVPIPDPMNRFVGMSWLRPAIIDILGDKAAARHKQAFFENGATPSMVVKSDIKDTKKWREWVELFRQTHEGAARAYKTLHLQAGADATVVGANLRQLDFKATQGTGESRIASASGMHPVLVALSEGLQGSSLNTGNFRAAAKATADIRFRPWWGNFASSMERLLPPLAGTRLWYDDQHIPFLAEDVKDAAEALGKQANAIRTLTDGGYEAASVVDAVTSNDLRRLTHTGYLPVQVQPVQGEDPAQQASARAYVAVEGMQAKPSMLPKPVGDRRATIDFTPLSGLLTTSGTVPRGTVIDAGSPHAMLFPSLFEAVAETTAEHAQRLRSQGKTVAEIAIALDRTERTVERALEQRGTAADRAAVRRFDAGVSRAATAAA